MFKNMFCSICKTEQPNGREIGGILVCDICEKHIDAGLEDAGFLEGEHEWIGKQESWDKVNSQKK